MNYVYELAVIQILIIAKWKLDYFNMKVFLLSIMIPKYRLNIIT